MRTSLGAVVVTVLLSVLVAITLAADSDEDFVRRHWRPPLAPQGQAPSGYTALEASLHPEACGTCHVTQYTDWRTSIHAVSMGPGVAGQLVEMTQSDPAAATGCYACHAPAAEQSPLVRGPERFDDNPDFDPVLRPKGVVCAGCHLRAHERFGPPRRDGSLARAAPRETLPHAGVTRTPAFLASEFCRSCHQFEANGPALNGKLLQDTYTEWKASRFAHEGRLLGERGVAAVARQRCLRLRLQHLDQLARDAGAHRLRVEARLPVGELGGMAGAARLRLERRLDGAEARGRRTLRRERHAPVTGDEPGDVVAAGDAGAEHDQGGDEGRDRARHPRHLSRMAVSRRRR